jgi:hypothetical protein
LQHYGKNDSFISENGITATEVIKALEKLMIEQAEITYYSSLVSQGFA